MATLSAGESFTLVAGEEFGVAYHMGSFDSNGLTVGTGDFGGTGTTVLNRMLDAVETQDALPILKHPLLGLGVSAAEIVALTRLRHMEIFNSEAGPSQSPDANEGMEALWDEVLEDHMIYVVGSDDSHGVQPGKSGGGFTGVASAAEPASIRAALLAGKCYASSGVEFDSIVTTRDSITVTAVVQSVPADYTVTFIGLAGAVLQTDAGTNTATYRLPTGAADHVRAVIEGPEGKGWIQPYEIK